jgi:chromosome segregation ATPase
MRKISRSNISSHKIQTILTGLKELEANNHSLKEALEENKSKFRHLVLESMEKQKMAEATKQEIVKLRNSIELMKDDLAICHREISQLSHDLVRAKTESNLSIQREFDQLIENLKEKENHLVELNLKRKEAEDKLTEQRIRVERLEKTTFDLENLKQELQSKLDHRENESRTEGGFDRKAEGRRSLS